MVKQFDDAAFKQDVKAIGPVVETQFSYHIIQVLERSQSRTKSPDEVKGSIKATIEQQRMQEAAERYIAELKSKAKIVYADTMAHAAKK